MPAQGRTWRSYSALLSRVALWASHPLTEKRKFLVQAEPQPAERELLDRFTQALAQEDPEAQDILQSLNISPYQFRYHLLYIARWSATRRQLLADGGNFQLLEGLKAEDEAGRLAGLVLQGSRTAQERALTEHLQQSLPAPQGHGWLSPVPNPGKPVREYTSHEVVWLYPTSELQRSADLHPSVARSLIRRYLPRPGVVVDPMAGSGTIARMAAMMGHRAWASDINPREPYIAQHDIQQQSLEEAFDETFDVAADLVFLHPPTPEELGTTDPKYLDWLTDVLENCWRLVGQGGHIVLITEVSERIGLLARAERALVDSAEQAFEDGGLEEEVTALTARHVAASRDGRQGWHILVMKRPALEIDTED